jgi:hypothetical protein
VYVDGWIAQNLFLDIARDVRIGPHHLLLCAAGRVNGP